MIFILKKKNRKYLIALTIMLSICIYFLYTKKENMSSVSRRRMRQRQNANRKLQNSISRLPSRQEQQQQRNQRNQKWHEKQRQQRRNRNRK